MTDRRDWFTGYIDGWLDHDTVQVYLEHRTGPYVADMAAASFPADGQPWLGRFFEILPRRVGRRRAVVRWCTPPQWRVLCGCPTHRDGLAEERPPVQRQSVMS